MKLSVPLRHWYTLLEIAMDTCASPSETMFRLAIPPAEAWLAACTPGTLLLHILVIAAPTAYRAPDAPAVGKLIFTVCAAGCDDGADAFFSPPQPAIIPAAAKAASETATAFFKCLMFIFPSSHAAKNK